MITATTIIATTITAMARRPFALTVTIRMPLTHAPHMDTGDQITSLTVYSSAPDLGTAAVGAAATTGVADTMAGAGMAGEVITDAEVMAAVDVAGTVAVDVAGMVAVDTRVAAILQEDMADTAAADAAGMVAVDTGVAAILQEDMADTAAVDAAGMAAVDAGTVVAVDVAGINPVEAVSMGVEEDSVAVVEEAVSTVAAVDRTAAVVEEAVSTVAVVDRTAAVADTKSAISLNLEERLAIPASFFA
jgi:hypothetical protein